MFNLKQSSVSIVRPILERVGTACLPSGIIARIYSNIPFHIVRKGEHEPSLVIFLAREKSCERMGAQWDRKV